MNSKFSQDTRPSRINWKKLLSAALLSAFALAPAVVGSTPAMADRDDNRNRNDNSRNNSDRDTRTYEGMVTNDQSGREFVLRLDSGQRVQVRSEERESRRLSSGDRVRVQGYFNRTGERERNNTRYDDRVVFRATDVQIIRNAKGDNRSNNGYKNDNNNGGIFGGYSKNNARPRTGVVTQVRGERRVTVRMDGRDYDVQTLVKISSNVQRGTQVRVVNGEVRGNNITGAVVVADKDYNRRDDNDRNNDYYGNGYGYGNDNGYYDNNNSQFDFVGRVSEVNERNSTIRVRGDNGRDYAMKVEDRNKLRNVRIGDIVRVRGQLRNGIAIADDVDEK